MGPDRVIMQIIAHKPLTTLNRYNWIEEDLPEAVNLMKTLEYF